MNISAFLKSYLFVKIRLKCGGLGNVRTWSCMIGFYIVLVGCSCFCATEAEVQDLDNDLIKKIWNELTPHEAHHIFGSSEQVPNLDIISIPKVFHPKIRIRNEEKEMWRENMEEKVIGISALGRRFNLTLSPNPNLISPDSFVHVFRHNKTSQILSDNIVKNLLPCFYHGTASHTQDDDGTQRETPDVKYGRAAINLCNGMKGFIWPNDGDLEHHYIIHPLPDRLHSKQHPNKKQIGKQKPHFFWRKRLIHPSVSTSEASDLSTSSSSCGHSHGHNFLPPTPANKRPPNLQEQQTTTSSNSELNEQDLHHHRSKRSYIDDTQFQYKPLSIAADSYWFRYRTTESPSTERDLYGHQNIATPNPNRRSDSVDYYSEGHEPTPRHYPASTTTTGQTNNDDNNNYSWSKGILVHESSETGPEVKQNPQQYFGGGTPFYTKLPEEDSQQENPSRRSGYNYPRRNSNYYTSSPTLYYSNNGTSQSGYYRQRVGSQWPIDRRRSRADDVIFGENWKSSLDSDIMSSAQSTFSQTRIHKNKEPAHLTIETAVFVDKDLYKHMESNFPDDTQEEVSRIVLAMINAVQLLYQDPSLGHRVDFVLKRLEVLATDPPGLLRPYDIDRFLTNFCKWQKTENPASDTDPQHWDHALILTGLDLYVVHTSGKISNQVVGLAPVAGMCTRSSSCTVNEGRHFESVYVVAHEIGHNLGMRHDGPQADNECDPSSHIMSPTLGSGKITWSACSKRYLDMFLETNQSKCLLDKAKSESRLDHDADGRLPGERFDADRQCVLKYGRGSYHATQQPLEDVCRDLHCRREHYTWTSHPALEGTFCGLDMWCRAGKCTIKTSNFISSFEQNYQFNNLGGSETAAYSAPKALDGGWGKWSPFTDCSSACLYGDGDGFSMGSTGIRLAARRCDSPRPENGGRQCSGSDRRYKTCSTEKICTKGAPKTSIGVYANEVCTRAATVDTELTGRGFMTTTDDQERACSVWCETTQRTGSRSRGWSFPDGTSCQLATNSRVPNFCVAGKCQFFGCDADSHYALSDEQCKILNLRSSEANSKTLFRNPDPDEDNYNTNKIGWDKWEAHSDCKLSCLAPAKGLELVKRHCNAQENQCNGLGVSVRLCKPDKSTILSNGCTRLHTPFEYATRICSQYSAKVPGLSGIGMQLSPTKDDVDRPCRVGCQDSSLLYRFYMVNGEEGWFPAGTDCSRGEPDKKTFCLGGKCVDFGADDTPLYRTNSKLLGKLESFFHRSKREIYPEFGDLSLDQASLSELVEKFSSKNSRSMPNPRSSISEMSLDFERPILVPSDDDSLYQMINFNNSGSYASDNGFRPADDRHDVEVDGDNFASASSQSMNSVYNWQNQPIEGSFYEWRKIVSDCSVSCGSGIQEVIVQCVSGDTKVQDSLCEPRPRPGMSGYINCERPTCSTLRSENSNAVWNWLQSVLAQSTDHRKA